MASLDITVTLQDPKLQYWGISFGHCTVSPSSHQLCKIDADFFRITKPQTGDSVVAFETIEMEQIASSHITVVQSNSSVILFLVSLAIHDTPISKPISNLAFSAPPSCKQQDAIAAMASYPYFSSDPYRSHADQALNHKVSNLSESSETQGPLRGRESLVSLQSFYDSPPLPPPQNHTLEQQEYGRGQWSVPFLGNNGGRYQPVSRTPSSFGRFRSFRGRVQQDTIHEDESVDMSLLSAAVPPAQCGSYEAVPKSESFEPAFDMTSFSGPMGTQDHEFLKSLQQQEASGRLTGGLGQGEGPNTTIKKEYLTSATPSAARSFTRSFSMRRKPTVNPQSSWKSLGQEEANKRGEVIEVIMEEHADVDLSSMIGPHTVKLDQATSATPPPKKEVFYPRPNWKPFAMRWPYLLFMILLSVALAIVQEFIYQMSRRPGGLLHFTSARDLNPGLYFVFKFVPTIITVTYGVLWQNTDFEVKRLEAFYQMSKDGGALAAESINVDYITLFNFGRPLLALHRKHYAVFISSVATLLAVSLVPTLGAAALVLSPDRATRLSNPDEVKMITVSAVLSRLLTATFFFIAILGCILFYQLTTRRSGLLADVKGIAGLASMAVVSHIMADFRDMDTAKPKDIHHKLKNRRYELRNSSLFSKDFMSQRGNDRYKDAHLSQNPHPLMLRREGCIPFIIGIVLFLILVPVFLFTPASVITYEAPWAVTALAVCIKLGWGSLETSIRMLEPYYILAQRHAPPKTLTLDYTAMPFAVVAFRALFNRHWIVFLVGWGTVLVEGLTIFATSLAQVEGKDLLDLIAADPGNLLNKELGSGSETVRSFVVTVALTGFILSYLIIVASFVFIRRRHPFLPRQPNTIASVLAFMHQSKMLYDFVGTAKFTNVQMREKLEALGKTYGLGWFSGRDGQMHCGVDEEELTGSYKHGVDYSQGNMPWLTDWQTF
ncbi:hypothetical protein F5B22DRAFT_647517 [Xylaria bambusicola]|uniref:uncharacterized protein n=1 Tax=Xylaria bambusicola TaxID=326684 RepID=UPI0020088985|nr:uncharacterized protein F5B22DRAFT_647517 [Xylaria bambusicola]KAI0514476.1 hypothetical protein F5B22DRAFT_647517 [Xylaria bambusicola]